MTNDSFFQVVCDLTRLDGMKQESPEGTLFGKVKTQQQRKEIKQPPFGKHSENEELLF